MGIIDSIKSKLGGNNLTALVNNAGVGRLAPFDQLTKLPRAHAGGTDLDPHAQI